ARTLDLDIIAVGSQVLPDAQTHQYWRELPLDKQETITPQELILPHPRLAERAFVLVPLLDIAPEWRHPITGVTIRQMHDALSAAQRSEVIAL
ncbi:MAG: 2-amino-4-hydroxy-6-hydroxymethyldihydropteridine diphosphokinase, partial [Sulfitobacter sp.]